MIPIYMIYSLVRSPLLSVWVGGYEAIGCRIILAACARASPLCAEVLSMDGCPEAFKAQSFIDALAEVRIKDVLAMEWLPQREREGSSCERGGQ